MMRGLAEAEDGETVEAMSGWARTYGVTLVGGSIVEQREGREKLSNTCVVFDAHGEIQAVYRKIHMFDVEVGGQVYRVGDRGARRGHGHDRGRGLEARADRLLRPPLPRALPRARRRGAEVITVPAAFTLFTGKDHWGLLRARAVENQCYVVAANQWGSFADGKAPTAAR